MERARGSDATQALRAPSRILTNMGETNEHHFFLVVVYIFPIPCYRQPRQSWQGSVGERGERRERSREERGWRERKRVQIHTVANAERRDTQHARVRPETIIHNERGGDRSAAPTPACSPLGLVERPTTSGHRSATQNRPNPPALIDHRPEVCVECVPYTRYSGTYVMLWLDLFIVLYYCRLVSAITSYMYVPVDEGVAAARAPPARPPARGGLPRRRAVYRCAGGGSQVISPCWYRR